VFVAEDDQASTAPTEQTQRLALLVVLVTHPEGSRLCGCPAQRHPLTM
jgi:hypothetical protein